MGCSAQVHHSMAATMDNTWLHTPGCPTSRINPITHMAVLVPIAVGLSLLVLGLAAGGVAAPGQLVGSILRNPEVAGIPHLVPGVAPSVAVGP
jgi:hypothetical protein